MILVLPNAKSPRRVTWAIWSVAASSRRSEGILFACDLQ